MRVGINTYLYVCLVRHGVAKLVEYKGSKSDWVATGTYYRLRSKWTENEDDEFDFSNFMTNPNHYEQVGLLGVNFVLFEDKLFLTSHTKAI